jgi:hypothetical protein
VGIVLVAAGIAGGLLALVVGSSTTSDPNRDLIDELSTKGFWGVALLVCLAVAASAFAVGLILTLVFSTTERRSVPKKRKTM